MFPEEYVHKCSFTVLRQDTGEIYPSLGSESIVRKIQTGILGEQKWQDKEKMTCSTGIWVQTLVENSSIRSTHLK